MAEHVPSRFLIAVMTGFFVTMAALALLFWMASAVLPGGSRAVIQMAGTGAVAIFATLHIPATIVGILLLQWHRPRLSRLRRTMMEAATLYFGLAVVISIFLNYMAASLLDLIS